MSEQPKIIQILTTEHNEMWQGRLLGLSSDGTVYSVGTSGLWEKFVPPLGFKRVDDSNG